mmetsp:Transcript_20820/g.30852  ORF Transcript_20820/g.30852 Transcript_20820/m.30852 type:complete len:146 (-) Transcript_20820:65-502(-)
MIYNLYIFNRKGNCLYYKEWNRPLNTLEDDDAEEKRLMFGMLYSLQELVGKLAIENDSATQGLQSYSTDAYTLNYYQTFSGLRFVLNTDNRAGDMNSVLKHIFGDIFVELVVKHPLYDPRDGSRIKLPVFEEELERYVTSLSCFD